MTQATDVMRCSTIGLCKLAATSEIVKHCSSRVWLMEAALEQVSRPLRLPSLFTSLGHCGCGSINGTAASNFPDPYVSEGSAAVIQWEERRWLVLWDLHGDHAYMYITSEQ